MSKLRRKKTYLFSSSFYKLQNRTKKKVGSHSGDHIPRRTQTSGTSGHKTLMNQNRQKKMRGELQITWEGEGKWGQRLTNGKATVLLDLSPRTQLLQ